MGKNSLNVDNNEFFFAFDNVPESTTRKYFLVEFEWLNLALGNKKNPRNKNNF